MGLDAPTLQMLLLCGLSMAIGWGIRGNFGHEAGAALPGALGAMALALMSGRPDWWARIHYFAMFGALGWSFGGSMSYMQVVGYTHSGHTPSILYGFANLFVIGFLWAAVGGAGIALPVFLPIEELTLFFAPIVAILAGWSLQAIVVDWLSHVRPMQRHESRLYWYDTDWLAALVASFATLAVAIFRGGFDIATSFILHLTVGWFAAFLVLVNLLRLRMTPPRGDNWSGCVGMVAGVFVFCWRFQLGGMAYAALLTGVLGGLGFSLGQVLKLIGLRTGKQTNWHSVMEQTQGFFFGIGQAIAFDLLTSRAPQLSDTPGVRPWTVVFAVVFLLVLVTYINHRKAAGTWVEHVASLPERPYGIPVSGGFVRSKGWVGWFELLYLAIGVAGVWLLTAHLNRPLDFIPTSWLGKAQLLCLVFLWWVVVFNFERALVAFAPQRLITEGLITFNAVICTVMMALGPQGVPIQVHLDPLLSYAGWIQMAGLLGGAALILMTLAGWAVTLAMYGHERAPGAGLNVRFGPNATATKAKPKAGQAHP